MRRRWIVYAFIGILFGVFDFFYQGLLQVYLDSSIVRVILTFAIWLVPAIPVVLHEAWITASRWKASLACILTWSAAIVSYYLYMGVALAFFSFSTRPELHVSNSASPYFLSNWISVLRYDILGGMIEWAVLGVVGGFLVGWVVSALDLAWIKIRGGKGLT